MPCIRQQPACWRTRSDEDLPGQIHAQCRPAGAGQLSAPVCGVGADPPAVVEATARERRRLCTIHAKEVVVAVGLGILRLVHVEGAARYGEGVADLALLGDVRIGREALALVVHCAARRPLLIVRRLPADGGGARGWLGLGTALRNLQRRPAHEAPLALCRGVPADPGTDIRAIAREGLRLCTLHGKQVVVVLLVGEVRLLHLEVRAPNREAIPLLASAGMRNPGREELAIVVHRAASQPLLHV
mmetsp:Transcript_13663/g.37267  ORF Transcript_13663/g.37267 Transcript_13663/m.37267 type:complete len:244 (-) Transcript_13663:143-874(-)